MCSVPREKLKGRLQIHDRNNVDDAVAFWSDVGGVPRESISVSIKPTKTSNRINKHVHGIFSIIYNSVGLKILINEAINALKDLTLNRQELTAQTVTPAAW